MQDNPAKSGTVGKFATQQMSHMIKFVSLIIIGGDTYSTMDPSVPLSASKIIMAKSHSTGICLASRDIHIQVKKF